MQKRFTFIFLLVILSQQIFGQTPNWSWVKSATGNYYIGSGPVKADGFGNVYTAGTYYNTAYTIAGLSLPFSSGGSVYFVKYNSSGIAQWLRGSLGSGYAEARGMCTDNAGNIYLTGLYSGATLAFGSTVLTNTNSTKSDIFLVKYDSTGNVLWARNAGGSDNEFADGLTIDPAGNVYISGSYLSPVFTLGSTVLTNANPLMEDVFLAKYDAAGNVIWARSGKGSGFEYATCATTDPYSNIFIAGTYSSPHIVFGNDTLFNSFYPNSRQMFLVKYNSAGDVVWLRQPETKEWFNEFYSVSTDAFGSVVVVGTTWDDTLTVGPFTVTNPATQDYNMIIAKYDSSGTPLWAKKVGGNYYDYGYWAETDASGNTYVAGHFQSDTLFFDAVNYLPVDPNYYQDMFLVKYDPNGNVMWAKNIGGIHQTSTYGYAMIKMSLSNDGDLYTAGSFQYDPLNFDGNQALLNGCYNNSFLAKLNVTGACGASFSLVADTSTLHNYWAINNAFGAAPLSYNWSWGDGTFDNIQYPVHTYSTPGYYTICLTITDALGCTNTVCHTNNLQAAPNSPSMPLMIQVNVVPFIPPPTSISENSHLAGIKMFPNPTRGNLYISSGNEGINQINISDVIGKKIYSVDPGTNNGSYTLDTSVLSRGIYLIEVITVKQTITKKIMVNR